MTSQSNTWWKIARVPTSYPKGTYSLVREHKTIIKVSILQGIIN